MYKVVSFKSETNRIHTNRPVVWSVTFAGFTNPHEKEKMTGINYKFVNSFQYQSLLVRP